MAARERFSQLLVNTSNKLGVGL